MKKIILLCTVIFLTIASASAQKYIVVNTETIFKSMASYNNAIQQLDDLGQQYQAKVDEAYRTIEQMYNSYQAQRATLSESTRIAREDAIIEYEQNIIQYQEEVFGQEGTLMQRRVELIKPIQDRVFEVINSYARTNGVDMVLDIASNPSLLYYTSEADKTDDIIRLLR